MCCVAKRFLLVAACLLLSACAAQPAAAPTFEVLPLVVVSPSMLPWAEHWLAIYEQVAGPAGFKLLRLPQPAARMALEQEQAELLLEAHPPTEGWFVTPLGIECLQLIINPALQDSGISAEDLADVFSGRLTSWPTSSGSYAHLQPIVPPPGDELQILLSERLLLGSPISLNALIAPTPEVMVALVAEHEGGFGVLPGTLIAEGVRRIAIDGLSACSARSPQPTYPFQVQLLASAPQQPSGAIRQWLLWIQAQTRAP